MPIRFLTRLIAIALVLLSQASAQEMARVPAAYVLDAEGKVAMAFGKPGTTGRIARCDSAEVPEGTTIKADSANPLQAAIDWAAEKGFRNVRLDAAEYTFTEPQASHTGRIGFYVPSGIHLKGVMVGEHPGTLLMPSQELEEPGFPRGAQPQQFEVLLLPSGSLTDLAVPLHDTTIEALALNCRLIGGVGMWAGGGTNFRLYRVHAMGSRQSALIVGHYSDWVEDPEVRFRGAIYYSNNFDVGWNYVHGANGDGICVIGHGGVVHDNICENGVTIYDNGITPFVGSTNIRFLNNRIVNFPTGIGLDGDFLAWANLPGVEGPEKSRALSIEKLWELYQGWEGYHRGHEIAGNEIINCRRGIVTHRADDISIHDNKLVGRGEGEGISLEETSNSRVWGNDVTGWDVACRLYAHSWSAIREDGEHIGTSFNEIGVDANGKPVGNSFRNNNHGIFLVRASDDAHLRRNVLRNNDCSSCNLPVVYSGGDDGDDRQFASGNKPETMNYPENEDKLQGP